MWVFVWDYRSNRNQAPLVGSLAAKEGKDFITYHFVVLVVPHYPKVSDDEVTRVRPLSSSSMDNKFEYYSAYQASCNSPFMPGTRWCGLWPNRLARSCTTSRNITVSMFSPSMYSRNQSPIFDLQTITSIASRRTNLEWQREGSYYKWNKQFSPTHLNLNRNK